MTLIRRDVLDGVRRTRWLRHAPLRRCVVGCAVLLGALGSATAQTTSRTISVERPIYSEAVDPADGTVRPRLIVPNDVRMEDLQRRVAQALAAMNVLQKPLTAEQSPIAPTGYTLPEMTAVLGRVAAGLDAERAATRASIRRGGPAVSAVSPLTPGLVLGGLLGIDQVLNDVLDHVDSIMTSQVFAIRSDVDATIADFDTVFKDRMDETFDRLDSAEQELLTQANVLVDKTTVAMRDLEQNGFNHALHLLCDAAAIAANTQLVVIDLGFFDRPKPAELTCLETPTVRDQGSNHEQLLQFRGSNLTPNGEYADAQLTVASSHTSLALPTAGGSTTLQAPLPGGLNGDFNDVKPRGDFVAAFRFQWPRAKEERRWMFVIKPFVVRSVEASITPIVDVDVFKTKSDTCYVHADGGSISSNTSRNTCTITTDSGYRAIACRSGVTTQNGDSGISNGPLLGAGSCQWEIYATSGSWWGAGAWYGMNTYLDEKGKSRIPAPTYSERHVANQPTGSLSVTYDKSLLPAGAQIVSYQYVVRITLNTGEEYVLTDTSPSNPMIGNATISPGGVLAIQFTNPL